MRHYYQFTKKSTSYQCSLILTKSKRDAILDQIEVNLQCLTNNHDRLEKHMELWQLRGLFWTLFIYVKKWYNIKFTVSNYHILVQCTHHIFFLFQKTKWTQHKPSQNYENNIAQQLHACPIHNVSLKVLAHCPV